MLERTAPEPHVFDLRLTALDLEAGARVDPHVVRGWWWGPESDLPALSARTHLISAEAMQRQAYRVLRRSASELSDIPPATASSVRFDEAIPTILVVHALTGDMRPGGPGGWWEPVVGPGRALDPSTSRILCFNNLGSCYGTSGPCDEGFPTQGTVLPAVVTPWDQARSIIAALDALGLRRVHLATGGSLGGMIVLCLAALAPDRFERIAPIASMEAASAWVIGWNHIAREVLLLDYEPSSAGDRPRRGLELARQIAMMTYRAEPGLDDRQGRAMAGTSSWLPRAPYLMETYLEHQGVKLRDRFDELAYLCQLGAMDHHDLGREPGSGRSNSWGIDRTRASVLSVRIDTDQLFFPAQMERLAAKLRERGRHVEEYVIRSLHGHDSFLIEWAQVNELLHCAKNLPPGL